MLHQRRTLLQYLRRTSFDKYAVLISRIGLKDSYGPQVGGALRSLMLACPAEGRKGIAAGGSPGVCWRAGVRWRRCQDVRGSLL